MRLLPRHQRTVAHTRERPIAGAFSIVCLSPQDWREALPTNRQQIMQRVAQRGHEVLFVESGYFLGRHLWRLFRDGDRRSLARRLFWTEQVAPGVRARKALNLLPWGARHALPNALNWGLTAPLLRRLAARRPQPVVLWIYDPRGARLTGSCGEEFAVYDCVDDYAEQVASVRQREFVAACDRLAAARSRLVFTTSRPLHERQRWLNSETYLVPNAGDYAHFARAADRSIAAGEVSELPRPVVGFAGNFLDSKVDFRLLEELAWMRPEWTLLLIGPSTSGTVEILQQLQLLPNVTWLGPKPYAELPPYVAAFDIGLIPYLSNAYTRSCFPLKLYEYLAAGKPVVASGLPELAGLEPDVVLAEGVEDLLGAIESALGRQSDAEKERRMRLASRNTWETRTERLLALVEPELDARRIQA